MSGLDREPPENHGKMEVYPLHGNQTWLAGKSTNCFNRKITYLDGPFSIAMVDCRMTGWHLLVGHWLASCMWLNHKQPTHV